jgi:hypothetical protein
VRREVTEGTVRQLSMTAAAFAYALLAALVLEDGLTAMASFLRLPAPLVATLAGAVTIVVLYWVAVRLGLLWWAAPVRGAWVYESSSGNWGLATVSVEGDGLAYDVELYKRPEHVLDALDGLPGSARYCFAHARSRVANYAGRRLEIVYYIDQSSPDYSPREGLLRLEPTMRSDEMKGYWKSDIEGDHPRRGVLDFWRESVFRAYMEQTEANISREDPR